MEMTFRQYIANPMGKHNAVFSQREVFRQIYTDKFDKVFLREAGKIAYSMYVDTKTDRYVIHIKIPSETVKNFYYDAVIMFYSNDAAAKSSPSLQDYFVKFFSNDPAFVFTYLRVFLKNDLFFEDLKPKASKLALTKDPKIKNPYEVPGYSKILYFAYLFMKSKNLFAKHMYTSYGLPYSPKKLLDKVEHTDTKIADRQEQGERQAKEKAEQKREEKKQQAQTRTTITNSPSGNMKAVKQSKITSTVNKTKNVNTVRTTKTTHKTPKKK